MIISIAVAALAWFRFNPGFVVGVIGQFFDIHQSPRLTPRS